MLTTRVVAPDPHPYIPDDAPGHPGCLAGRDLPPTEPKSSKQGHHCLGLPAWAPLGRISGGVGLTLSSIGTFTEILLDRVQRRCCLPSKLER